MEQKQKIRGFIRSNLLHFDAEEELADTDNIFQLGYVNSLFAIKLLNYVEKEFGITVRNEEMSIANFSSVNSISKLVETKLNV